VLVSVITINSCTGSDEQSLRAKVLENDPADVTELISIDYQTGEKTQVIKEDGIWVIFSDGQKYSADIDAIHNAIMMLSQLNTESIVASSTDKWEEYRVDDQQAIHLVLNAGAKQVVNLYIGKFDFEQIPATQPGREPETKMISYVRPEGEEKIYVVSGLLRSNFQGGKNPFRNRTIFILNPNTNIFTVSINGPEGSMILDVRTAEWKLNGMPVDNTKTDKYLRSLSRKRSSSFLDEVDVSNMMPVYSITIEGDSYEPVIINAYAADNGTGYYITSTVNPGAVFDGSQEELFEKIFVSSDELLKK
jgi:hypothetical protein